MKTLALIVATTLILVGCQTVSTPTQTAPRENTGYLSDSGSRKAAASVGQELDLSPGLPDPEWVPLLDGIELAYNANYGGHPSEMKLSNNAFLSAENWNDYLKDLALSLEPDSRQAFLDGITRHFHTFDMVEQNVLFAPAFHRRGPYVRSSFIGISGVIDGSGNTTSYLNLQYYGDSWIFADSVTIRAGNEVIRFNDVDFSRDNAGGKVWEVAYLNLANQEHRSAINKILSSDNAIVRLAGDKHYDIPVTNRMREDISTIIAGIQAFDSSNIR